MIKSLLRIIKLKIQFRELINISLFCNLLDGCKFEGNNYIGKFTTFRGTLGRYSYIGDHSTVFGRIGRYTSIASYVRVINGRHPFKSPYVSTSPMFYSNHSCVGKTYVDKQLYNEYVYVDEVNRIPVDIGNDCWIGLGAGLISGITIGNGAVVLSYALVTKDVEPYAIVGGVPARVLGYRYDMEIINKLNKICWWDKNPEWIKEKSAEFVNIDEFVNLLRDGVE